MARKRKARTASKAAVGASMNMPLGMCNCNHYGSFSKWLGFIFLLLGVVWVARDIGWISPNISMWAVAFVFVGIVMLFSGIAKTACNC